MKKYQKESYKVISVLLIMWCELSWGGTAVCEFQTARVGQSYNTGTGSTGPGAAEQGRITGNKLITIGVDRANPFSSFSNQLLDTYLSGITYAFLASFGNNPSTSIVLEAGGRDDVGWRKATCYSKEIFPANITGGRVSCLAEYAEGKPYMSEGSASTFYTGAKTMTYDSKSMFDNTTRTRDFVLSAAGRRLVIGDDHGQLMVMDAPPMSINVRCTLQTNVSVSAMPMTVDLGVVQGGSSKSATTEINIITEPAGALYALTVSSSTNAPDRIMLNGHRTRVTDETGRIIEPNTPYQSNSRTRTLVFTTDGSSGSYGAAQTNVNVNIALN